MYLSKSKIKKMEGTHVAFQSNSKGKTVILKLRKNKHNLVRPLLELEALEGPNRNQANNATLSHSLSLSKTSGPRERKTLTLNGDQCCISELGRCSLR